jgi:hypothetical protein
MNRPLTRALHESRSALPALGSNRDPSFRQSGNLLRVQCRSNGSVVGMGVDFPSKSYAS